MKRMISLLLSVSVLSIAFVAPVSASAQPGTTCSKAGLIFNSPSKKFTCVKLGKILVWNNGIPLSKKIPTPVPSPSTDGQSAETKLAAKTSFDAIKASIKDTSRIRLTFENGGTINSELLKSLSESINNSSSIYTNFLNSDFEVTVYLYTEKDLDVVRKNNILSGQQDTFTFFDWYAKDKNIKNNSVGIAGHTYFTGCKNDPSDCNPTFNAAGAGYPSYSTVTTQDLGNLTTPSHELFHVIQDRFLYEDKGAKQYTQQEMNFANPAIFREGSATFMQCVSSFKLQAQYELCLNNKKAWLKADVAEYKKVTSPQTLAAYLNDMESAPQNASHYVLGALFTEWLISKFGLSKFIQLVQVHSIKKDFKEVFYSTFGITLAQAYTDSSKHIWERMR